MTIDAGVAAILGGLITKFLDLMWQNRSKKQDELTAWRAELRADLERSQADLEECRRDRAELHGRVTALGEEVRVLREQLAEVLRREKVLALPPGTPVVGTAGGA